MRLLIVLTESRVAVVVGFDFGVEDVFAPLMIWIFAFPGDLIRA
jgi:hypothetical protein